MTPYLTVLFWTGLLLILYTYVGYGAVIALLSGIKRPYKVPHLSDDELPEVTILVAAYNEEQFIADKIRNTLSLDYPKDKLTVFIVTDGSTDHTPEIVKKFHAVKLFHQPARKGKINAINRVMTLIKTPIVVFTDANTLLNRQAIRNMVRHYTDPHVGGIAGEKRILQRDAENATGSGEGIYWHYESYLKKKDSHVGSVVGAAGELFSIRTRLYQPPPPDSIIEDFILSLGIAAKGYRFLYEPDAFAVETASLSAADEWKRKVRICAGGFQAIVRLRTLLNPLKYGMLSFQYISHRVLRWSLAPLFLPIVFVCNALLVLRGVHPVYPILLVAQILFYLQALMGFAFRERSISIRGFFVPYYFLLMNAAVFAGLKRYLMGQQAVTWEKARRARMTPESVNT